MPKYICETTCYWNGIYYNIGDTYMAKEGERVPKHFFPADPPEVEPKKKPGKKGHEEEEHGGAVQ